MLKRKKQLGTSYHEFLGFKGCLLHESLPVDEFYHVLTVGMDDGHVPRIKLVNHKYSVDG